MFRTAKQPSSERSLSTSFAVVAQDGIYTFICYKRQQHPNSLNRSVVTNGWLSSTAIATSLPVQIQFCDTIYSSYLNIRVIHHLNSDFGIENSQFRYQHPMDAFGILCTYKFVVTFFSPCNWLEFKRKFTIFRVVVQYRIYLCAYYVSFQT